jgi:acetone monooxygenase (methyl acetate-forming)
MTQAVEDFDAVVVGAGIAGLYQLYRLREMGFSVRGLEAAPAVGGTWYWNCYPGARVDSESYIYQYWFSDELIQEWNWSERFPAQQETERYLNFVADKFELRKDIDFSTRVIAADWDEGEQLWAVNNECGKQYRCRFLVSCTGMLSAPQIPPFPGHDKYRGVLVHTARYPREGLDLSGKRVGVVGCGATGIQVIQTIASEVGALKVFQRTPSYAVAMNNYKLDDEARNHWRSQSRELEERVHHTYGGFLFDGRDNGSWYDATPERRQQVLEENWADGSLAMWTGTFEEVLLDEEVNEQISDFVRTKISARIEDPAMAEKLMPRSYGYGTHRVPLESGFYDAFNRDNVELVDLLDAPIECFTEAGIRTAKAEYELDVIILATGFDAGTGALTRMNIRGRDGISLTQEWGRDIRSTLGLQVCGFPNLFTVAGPLAPSTAFCNMTTCLQRQVDWISDCIAYVRDQGSCTVEPTLEMQDAWVAQHDEIANSTLLVKTDSWYTGANVEGKPQRLLSYAGGVDEYRRQCDEIRDSGYPGFVIS